jgi:hypothetical protein
VAYKKRPALKARQTDGAVQYWALITRNYLEPLHRETYSNALSALDVFDDLPRAPRPALDYKYLTATRLK